MVTEVETREKVQASRITLEEFGRMIGIPIAVRPWWGSVREQAQRVHRQCGTAIYPYNYSSTRYFCPSCQGIVDIKDTKLQPGNKRWLCPGGDNHTRPKFPEVQNGKIIIWEGTCRFRYHWGRPKMHDHAQTIEVKGVGHKAMLIVIRRSPTCYSQFLIGVDGSSPYAVMVKRRINTVREAFDWLMPNIVRKAIAQGLDVKRQGDWFFIPRGNPPVLARCGERVHGSRPELETNALYHGEPLVFNGAQTRHRGGLVVYQAILGTNGPVPLVRGQVKAPDHETLHLNGWHIAVRNRSHPWRNADQRRRSFDD